MRADIKAQAHCCPERCFRGQPCAIRRGAAEDLRAARWFSEDWLHRTPPMRTAPLRRRSGAGAVCAAEQRERDQADQTIRRSHQQILGRDEVEDAKRQRDEAERQIALLCNNTGKGQGDGDFYPIATWPARASCRATTSHGCRCAPLPGGRRQRGHVPGAPRFLALTEFGPQNVIYHEGRKFRVTRTQLPLPTARSRRSGAQKSATCAATSIATPTPMSASSATRSLRRPGAAAPVPV